MDFDALPLEIKFHILSFLTEEELRCKFATTCKEWRSLAKDPYLKKDLSVTDKHQQKIIELLNAYSGLRELKLHDVNNWLWINEMPALMSVSKLTILRGRFITSSDTILQLIARVPYIEELHVVVHVSWISCMTQIPACKLLKKLVIHIHHTKYSEQKSCTCGDVFIENCSRLREIDANGTRPNKETFLKIMKLFSIQLRKLVLNDCNLTDATLQLLNKFAQLTFLRIDSAKYLSHLGLTSIKHLIKLQRLEIIDCYNNFIQFFNDASLPNLSVLFIKSDVLQDKTLQLIAKNYPWLREVGFGGSMHISDNGINAIIDNCCLIEKLKVIGLRYITGTSFIDIETRLPNITELNFLGCSSVMLAYITEVKRKKPGIRVYGINGYVL